MTKIYIGNDTYEVYLSSGKTLVLTEGDMREIAEGIRPPLVNTVTPKRRLRRKKTTIR